MSIEKDTEKETQWQNFKQMVANMSDDKFYEEVVSCRMISFGSCEGDDKEYFFDLINAYAENKYKAKAEVDEDELDKLAEENCMYCDFAYDCGECRLCEDDTARDGYIKGFKDGYRKAKEESDMNRYTINCTEEQTKKALELGAPIELESEYYHPTENDFKLENPIECRSFINGYHYAKCPTAEQMIGWLEEQGIWIHFCKPNQRPELLSFSVSNMNEPFRRVFVGGEYNSREKATLAAIDAALEYLIKNKK